MNSTLSMKKLTNMVRNRLHNGATIEAVLIGRGSAARIMRGDKYHYLEEKQYVVDVPIEYVQNQIAFEVVRTILKRAGRVRAKRKGKLFIAMRELQCITPPDKPNIRRITVCTGMTLIAAKEEQNAV